MTNTKSAFLKELFEYEYCPECFGDVQHHQEVTTPGIGLPFAFCLYSPSEATGWEWHPVIKAFHTANERKK
jgi:hypothetical protein